MIGRGVRPWMCRGEMPSSIKASGYNGAEWFQYDAAEPNQSMAIIGSRLAEALSVLKAPEAVIVVSLDPDGQTPKVLCQHLESAGIATTLVKFGDELPNKSAPALYTIAAETTGQLEFSLHMPILQEFFKNQEDQKAIWITHPTQFHSLKNSVHSADIIAAVRGATKELDLPNYIIQIDRSEPRFTDIIKDILSKVS